MGIFKLCIKSLENNDFNKDSSTSVWGEIYVEADVHSFPTEGWYDAVSSVMDMWIPDIISFIQSRGAKGSKCVLYFMDGPYKMCLDWTSTGDIRISMFESQREVASTRCYVRDFLSSINEGVTTFCVLCKEGNTEFMKGRTFSRIVENGKRLTELALNFK